jgi:hypothetical protein
VQAAVGPSLEPSIILKGGRLTKIWMNEEIRLKRIEGTSRDELGKWFPCDALVFSPVHGGRQCAAGTIVC